MLEDILDERNPSIAGILSGISKGKTWIYEKGDTILAIAYSYCVGGCGIVGNVTHEYEKNIKEFMEKVFEDLKKSGINSFEFSAEDEYIYEEIFKLFPNKKFNTEMEYSYRLKPLIKENIITKKEFEFLEVEENVIKDMYSGKYLNAEMFLGRYTNSWKSIDDFLKYSKSYIAVKDKEIVGVIFGSSRYKDVIVVDIEVKEKVRKQGIATVLCNNIADKCAKEDITIQWDHVESNIASQKLAQKIGFTLFKKRPYYWFDIK